MIDIVMPVKGSIQMTIEAIQSLKKNTSGKYRLIVTCDHSQEDVKQTLESTSELAVLNTGEQGFAATCNYGASRGNSPLVLFLNSDVWIVDPGWLLAMVAEFADQRIGAVGSKMMFFDQSVPGFTKKGSDIRPPGTVQHAGVAFDFLNRPYHMFLGWAPWHPKVSRRLKVNAVTGACLMTRRSVFEKIGGFDTAYTLGNFEDMEYCLKVRSLGYDIVYTPDSYLYHYAGGSGNTQTAKFNEILFHHRCHDLLVYDEYHYYFGDGLL